MSRANGAGGARFEGATREHFLRFLDREFPHLAPRVDRLYAGKYAPRHYRDQVHHVLDLVQRRHRLPRPRAAPKRIEARREPAAPARQPRLL